MQKRSELKILVCFLRKIHLNLIQSFQEIVVFHRKDMKFSIEDQKLEKKVKIETKITENLTPTNTDNESELTLSVNKR